ncbi:uncharacterized protein LOC115880361 [Sitophilus oryzae]|uniref:Uncharacterized protein LOC115880361 n=1 Tax=Sitophilus oryzae TaxID=7048 RepID=A0A6J2XPX3_SITOR|nr:uncharacterized protein LOC115880361 [Sitophilus oryzae]
MGDLTKDIQAEAGGDLLPPNEELEERKSTKKRSTGVSLRSQLPRPQRSVNRRLNPGYYLQDNLENPPSRETVHEANALYLLMLREQMQELGLEIAQIDPALGRHRPGFWNARNLRALAGQFAQSPQRLWVYEQAQNVDLDSLNFITFQQLLNGLFEEGGVTWERVLVLFYFCTDLSVRAFQEKFINHFLDIYNWTTVFLSGRFSSWVESQGGWGTVLHRSVNYVTGTTLVVVCCLAIAAGFWYLKRR